MRRFLCTLALAACLGLALQQDAGAAPVDRPVSLMEGRASADAGVVALLGRLYARFQAIFDKCGPSMDPWG